MAYLNKIKGWGKGNEAVHITHYEPSFLALALLVLYVPLNVSDTLLMLLRRFR